MLALLLALIGWGVRFNVSRFGEPELHAQPIPPGQLFLDTDPSDAPNLAIASGDLVSRAPAVSSSALAAVFDAMPVRRHGHFLLVPQAVPPWLRPIARRFPRSPPPLS